MGFESRINHCPQMSDNGPLIGIYSDGRPAQNIEGKKEKRFNYRIGIIICEKSIKMDGALGIINKGSACPGPCKACFPELYWDVRTSWFKLDDLEEQVNKTLETISDDGGKIDRFVLTATRADLLYTEQMRYYGKLMLGNDFLAKLVLERLAEIIPPDYEIGFNTRLNMFKPENRLINWELEGRLVVHKNFMARDVISRLFEYSGDRLTMSISVDGITKEQYDNYHHLNGSEAKLLIGTRDIDFNHSYIDKRNSRRNSKWHYGGLNWVMSGIGEAICVLGTDRVNLSFIDFTNYPQIMPNFSREKVLEWKRDYFPKLPDNAVIFRDYESRDQVLERALKLRYHL